METRKVSSEFGGRKFSIETGIANQANGSVLVSYEDTIILVTACANRQAKDAIDFLPLTVDYIEKSYSAGKIPGGFMKREGKPSDREILSSRLIDRPLRPLFPNDYHNETHVVATVLSYDPTADPDIVAITGASAALIISDIPYTKPIAGVRVGKIDGNLVLNPTRLELEKSTLNITIAGTKDALTMVEGESRFEPEAEVLEAIFFGHEKIKELIKLQEELAHGIGKTKWAVVKKEIDSNFYKQVRDLAYNRLKEALTVKKKKDRELAVITLFEEIVTQINDGAGEDKSFTVQQIYGNLEKEIIRSAIVKEKKRVDGRSLDEIRPISCRVRLLPRTHGSGLFKRGETEALVVTTLGTSEDAQRVDNITGEGSRKFMLHYNFPPFSTGEARFLRGPGRREIGHGNLAERALAQVLPDSETFPYTLRIVSDIWESNGSSSMATVCGGSLSLMDAGVPVKSHVAGIAMGLIKEGNDVFILTDILGDEDHVGDMDFKVAGTSAGVTAIQMDIKIEGVTKAIVQEALEKARVGRLHILDSMTKAIVEPHKTISIYAPQIKTIFISPERIKDLIGPGGKNIKRIIEETNTKIDVDDTGKVNIASYDVESGKKALEMINELTEEVVVGKIYNGKVVKIMDFGAFVEILPNVQGLVHISNLDFKRTERVTDVVHEGDEIAVKVLEIDRQGRIKLSRKDALKS